MSDNPYSPPSAELGSAIEVTGRGGTGDFDIGVCLSDAWAHTWEYFPLWLGAGIVSLLAISIASVTVIGLVLVPALTWGATLFVLRMHDGGAEFQDIFSGFSCFGQAFRTIVVIFLALLGLTLLAQSVQMIGGWMNSDLVSAIGVMVYLAFNLLALPRLSFAIFYAVDRGVSGSEALRLSWEETDRCKWKVVVLALLAYPMMLAGILALLIGVIPATVIWYLMYVSAYRQIAGTPGAA